MPPKRKINNNEIYKMKLIRETTNFSNDDLDKYNNEVDDSDDGDIVGPIRQVKQIVFDDTDNEEENCHKFSEEWIWEVKNNQPKIWHYIETPGIKITKKLDQNNDILDSFYSMFCNMFWENVVNETNLYAEQALINDNKIRKLDATWVPVNSDEIKLYFALCIIMAQIKKPKIQMYWSKRAVLETPIFRETMPLTRFLQITKFLHFTHNSRIDHTDRLSEIEPIINFFNDKFKEIYTMEEDIAIDKSLMKFKGTVPYKQLNPSKRARFVIKIYKLCESASGYCYHFKIYTGNDKISSEDSLTENVIELSESVLNKGHTLYVDNWYASPKLFLTLIANKTNAIGTVHSNRKNMPKDLIKIKLKKGEYVMKSSNGVLALKWKDNQDIYVISTKHETVEMVDPGESECSHILKPKCIIDYNKGMLGISHQDQMLACFPIMSRYMKGYRKTFFYIFDMALYNTYILYKKLNEGKKQSYAEYRIDTAELILKTIKLPEYKRQGPVSCGDTPLRLQALHWAHFPKHIDPTPLKEKPSRACKVCTKHKIRSETTWECKRCRVALHIPKCFERYHTVDDY